MKQLNFILALVLISLNLSGQVGVGEWTDYLSYSNGIYVSKADGKIYCITTGGLFSYDQSDNSIHKLNQINGLSDILPEIMAYGVQNDVIILAYANSNLDLIFEQEIVNLSDIKRKQIQGDKRINNILVVGATAYLSCGFGIVAVNLDKREIKDTYYIGNEGSQIVVNDMAFDGTYLYAATDDGIFRADINAFNLQDYHSWLKLETIPHSEQSYTYLEFFNNAIIACYVDENSGAYEIYKSSGDAWKRILSQVKQVKSIEVCRDQLVIAEEGYVGVYDSNQQLTKKVTNYSYPSRNFQDIKVNHAICDEAGSLWMADAREGLVREISGNYEQVIPEGPVDNQVFSMYTNGSDLWVTAGGRNVSWNNVFNAPQVQLYRDGTWQVFNQWNYSEFVGFHDIVNVAIDPTDPDHVFFGSWGGGVIEMRGTEFVERYNQVNSSLQTALPGSSDPNYARIGGMAFDSKNNLWVTNSLVGEPLSVYTNDGEWKSFELEGIGGMDVGDIVIANNNDQWIVVPRGNDLFVRKADGTDGRHLKLITYFNNGEQEEFYRMNNVYSIVKDKEGAIWVGTSSGVAVYYNPEEIWKQSSFYASPPSLELGDGIFHPLLRTEQVTAIAVDGANRKWLGTSNSGVFLVSEDGQEELVNFNESNSPILSNSIQSIAVNDQTGEVYFATPEGIIAYRGEATVGGDEYADVYAFPNPVRESYDGDIVITGLIADTDVKITDISGNLVYETMSLGGQAIWDGRNLKGHRVSTGVYVVFGNDKSGEKTFTTKILFIH